MTLVLCFEYRANIVWIAKWVVICLKYVGSLVYTKYLQDKIGAVQESKVSSLSYVKNISLLNYKWNAFSSCDLLSKCFKWKVILAKNWYSFSGWHIPFITRALKKAASLTRVLLKFTRAQLASWIFKLLELN